MSNSLISVQIIFISVFPFLLFFFSNLYTFFFSKNGININSREFYECGFKSITDNQVVLDIHYITIGLIFLIYEMEIILFVPIFINYMSYNYLYIFIILYVIFIISLSYIYE
jgi:NADH:ubiquinone oxidoreductase subunit 3 (subunit A)